MKQRFAAFLAAMALLLNAACTSHGEQAYGYDPAADAFAQLERARGQARSEGKLILVTAGGAWCGACRGLHDFLEEDLATRTLLEQTFVPLHVYIGEENLNEKFFERLPRTRYVPHLWILNAEGKVLGEQDPEKLEFEADDGYDTERFAHFIARWQSTPVASLRQAPRASLLRPRPDPG